MPPTLYCTQVCDIDSMWPSKIKRVFDWLEREATENSRENQSLYKVSDPSNISIFANNTFITTRIPTIETNSNFIFPTLFSIHQITLIFRQILCRIKCCLMTITSSFKNKRLVSTRCDSKIFLRFGFKNVNFGLKNHFWFKILDVKSKNDILTFKHLLANFRGMSWTDLWKNFWMSFPGFANKD